jgi:hypothetical protein
VAEEVRNLAMRSAQAAKETSGLIELSQRRANQGVEATDRVAKQLATALSVAHDMDQVVREVAVAIEEQKRGIVQIRTAVTQMNQVVQANAANAEETAATSDELAAQSDALHSHVQDVTRLIFGSARGNDHAPQDAPEHPSGKEDGGMRVKQAPPALPLRERFERLQGTATVSPAASSAGEAEPGFRDL